MEQLANQPYQIYYHNLMRARHFNPAFYFTTSPEILLSAPEPLTGYHFLGWYGSPAGNHEIPMIPHGSASDFHLYARWEPIFCSLIYHANESTDSKTLGLPKSTRIREGESLAVSDCIPARTGFLFLGWNTSPDGFGTAYRPGAVLRNMTADMELYCQWMSLTPSGRQPESSAAAPKAPPLP